MGFFESLKKILNVDIAKKLEKINLQFLSGNKKYEYHDNRSMTVNIGAYDRQTQQNIKKLIDDFFNKEDGLILEESTDKILKEVNPIVGSQEDYKLLEFYRGVIPTQDLEILRASLVIKSLYEQGQDINNLKFGLLMRYGERGGNISNLCTAGYFHTFIKPLYEHMYSQTNFSSEQFLVRDEVIVMQFPFAVFVGRSMSYDNLIKEVAQKVERSKKYGAEFINIHGIGERNVKLINRFISENKNKLKKPFELDSGFNYIKVKIDLR